PSLRASAGKSGEKYHEEISGMAGTTPGGVGFLSGRFFRRWGGGGQECPRSFLPPRLRRRGRRSVTKNRIATTSPDGLTTRFEHDHANHTHTTVLPGGATRTEPRYLGGFQSKGGCSMELRFRENSIARATGH